MGWAWGYPYIFRHPHAPSTMCRTWAYAWGTGVVVGGRGRLMGGGTPTVRRCRNGPACSPALPHLRVPACARPPPRLARVLPPARAQPRPVHVVPRARAPRPVPPRPRTPARAPRPAPPACSRARAPPSHAPPRPARLLSRARPAQPRPAPPAFSRARAPRPAPPTPHPSPINCEITCGVVVFL